MPTMKELGLDRLTDDERCALGHELLDSLHSGEPGSTLTDAKRAEIARRLADMDANPDDSLPWEEVRTAARARAERRRQQ